MCSSSSNLVQYIVYKWRFYFLLLDFSWMIKPMFKLELPKHLLKLRWRAVMNLIAQKSTCDGQQLRLNILVQPYNRTFPSLNFSPPTCDTYILLETAKSYDFYSSNLKINIAFRGLESFYFYFYSVPFSLTKIWQLPTLAIRTYWWEC
jgi:hypothetical protein